MGYAKLEPIIEDTKQIINRRPKGQGCRSEGQGRKRTILIEIIKKIVALKGKIVSLHLKYNKNSN